VCTKVYYMTAQPWMYSGTIMSKMAGPIKCPKCRTQLGRYHWLRDLPCSCRERVPCVVCAADGDSDAAHFCLDAALTSFLLTC
ncbi:hypothetical protein FHG87_023966, partial [Trinorchestia longiramus]